MSDIVEFPWRPGMRLFLPQRADDRMARVIRIKHKLTYTLLMWALESAVEQNPMTIGRHYGYECRPDLDDAATKGALAEAVRELYDEPRMFVVAIPGGWAICRGATVEDSMPDVMLADGTWDCDHPSDDPEYLTADTEAGAWLAAYHAAKGGSNG